MFISCKSFHDVTQKKENQNSDVKYKNIKITESNAFPMGSCEPSIAISKKNPQFIVAGNVMKDIHYSNDGGVTWTHKQLTSKHGVFGDPCIISDKGGLFYYLHLADPDNNRGTKHFLNQIVLQKSIDNGGSWTDGTSIGLSKDTQQDKEWATTHPISGEIYTTWTEFDHYGSKNPEHKSRILFSISEDEGKTFSTPICISEMEGDAIDDDYTTEGAVPAVDNEGIIYVSWAFDNKIIFDKSVDKGKTWLKHDRIIAKQVEGWNHDIPGIGRCNGMPVTAVDVSNSNFQGSIYVNWTDQRNGKNDTDVFLIKSSDQGATWSKPIRVNTDQTKTQQFFTWMSVDPITGYIYIVFYDRSRHTDNKTDVVLAVSKDGGNSFTNEVISEEPFTPTSSVFFGDYNNIDAYNGVIRPIWTRYEKGKLSVWTAIINLSDIEK